jgi:hypothetical protein
VTAQLGTGKFITFYTVYTLVSLLLLAPWVTVLRMEGWGDRDRRSSSSACSSGGWLSRTWDNKSSLKNPQNANICEKNPRNYSFGSFLKSRENFEVQAAAYPVPGTSNRLILKNSQNPRNYSFWSFVKSHKHFVQAAGCLVPGTTNSLFS